jgi:hypothetical protein
MVLRIFCSALNFLRFQTISAAFWLYLLMGQRQSFVQMVALLMLLVAGALNINSYLWPCFFHRFIVAIVLNMPSGDAKWTGSSKYTAAETNVGIICVLVASLLSGLSAALTQRALVGADPRHSFFFSAELAVYGILFILISLLFSNGEDARSLKSGTLFQHWDLLVLVPVTTNVSTDIM